MALWMLLNVLTFLVFIVGHGAAFCYEDIYLSEPFREGTKGIAFSDISGVKLGQMLSSVTVGGAESIDQVTVRVKSPDEATWTHGGSGGTDDILIFGDGECVTSMEIHVAKKSGSKRVLYLKLVTNEGNSVSRGTKTDESATVDAPEGFQLSGVFGRAGTEVYELGVIWTRINATYLALTDDMGSEWYGKKIRNWVGPTIGDAVDSACCRKTETFSRNQLCPAGYNKTDTYCIAQCPLSYPVKCGLECIPQNDDCMLEILQKTASVVSVIFNTATVGVFGEVKTAYRAAHQTYICAASIIGLQTSLMLWSRKFNHTTGPLETYSGANF